METRSERASIFQVVFPELRTIALSDRCCDEGRASALRWARLQTDQKREHMEREYVDSFSRAIVLQLGSKIRLRYYSAFKYQ